MDELRFGNQIDIAIYCVSVKIFAKSVKSKCESYRHFQQTDDVNC